MYDRPDFSARAIKYIQNNHRLWHWLSGISYIVPPKQWEWLVGMRVAGCTCIFGPPITMQDWWDWMQREQPNEKRRASTLCSCSWHGASGRRGTQGSSTGKRVTCTCVVNTSGATQISRSKLAWPSWGVCLVSSRLGRTGFGWLKSPSLTGGAASCTAHGADSLPRDLSHGFVIAVSRVL